MPYIGVSPQFGVRRKHTYTATAGQTSFSGAGSEGATLSYKDSNFVDVYQNGVKLGDADYTSTSGTAIVLAQGASVDDLIEIIVFDAFSAADTVSKADGGTFDGNVTMAGTLAVTGVVTANAGIKVDNITIDGTEIDLSGTGDFTVDVGGDIILDSDGADILLKHDGTHWGSLYTNATPANLYLQNMISDGDIYLSGNDGGSNINALVLDMSANGDATFNNTIRGASSSEGSPTYSFSSDTDTGMFSPGADIIGLSSSGTERYRFSYNSLSLMDTSLASARFNISSDIGSYTGMTMKTTTNRDNSYFIAFFNASTTLIGGVTQNGTSNVTFETSSDYRLKENVNYNFDATTRLKQLKPCRFNFIEDGADKVFDGFLAHEVSSIVPQAVSREKDETRDIGTIKDEDGNVLKTDAPEVQKEDNQTWEKTGTENVYQGIDHSKLVPLLTKALQEQQATIEALEARITALESK